MHFLVADLGCWVACMENKKIANYAIAKIYYEDTSTRHAYLIQLQIVTDTVEAEEMLMTRLMKPVEDSLS